METNLALMYSLSIDYLLTVQEDSDEEEVPKKGAASKNNGIKAAAKKADSDSDESEEDSDEDSDSEEAKPAKTNGTKAKAKADSDEDEDEESSEEDESEEESEEKEEAKPTPTAGQKRKDAPAATETPSKRSKPDSGSVSIFVGNLSWNIDQDWLASIFESVGGVVSARIITDRDSGRPKGFGYVDFETPEQAQKALELKDTEVDGRAINVDLAQAKTSTTDSPRGDRAQKFGDKISEPSSTLFVGNLSFNSTQDSLYELFGQGGGAVTSVRLPTDRETGQAKGYILHSFSV